MNIQETVHSTESSAKFHKAGRKTAVCRKRKMLSLANIEETRKKKCCKKNCMEEILTMEDVMEARSLFWEKDREEQGQWLLHFFSFAQKMKNGKQQLEYIVNKEKEVCQKAWIFSHGLSYGRYKN